jgi:hypothetical protein
MSGFAAVLTVHILAATIWTGGHIVLAAVALTLFLAGAKVLPTGVGDYPEDLYEYFREDGRSGVALVAAPLKSDSHRCSGAKGFRWV